MIEGKLLGHIVVSQGVKIDLERVVVIDTISFPRHKKALQTFFRKINFLWRFIPNFVELTKYNIIEKYSYSISRGVES